MEFLAGLLADLLIIFQDFKSWFKKRRRPSSEWNHSKPKTKWFRRFQKILMVGLLVILTFYLLRVTIFLSGNAERETIKKLSVVATLLKHEKETLGHYPEKLEVVVRKNPLLKNIHKDYWGQEFYYERHASGESYILISLGADGQLDTPDDIEYEFKIE